MTKRDQHPDVPDDDQDDEIMDFSNLRPKGPPIHDVLRSLGPEDADWAAIANSLRKVRLRDDHDDYDDTPEP